MALAIEQDVVDLALTRGYGFTTVELASVVDAGELAALEGNFPVRERWSVDAWRAELRQADRRAWVARHGGMVVGAALFQVVAETADLHRIVVDPGYRRAGLARQLMAAGLSWAADEGATRVVLEVRPDNQGAVELYRGLGFVEISRRRDYYAPGVDCLVMSRDVEVDQ